MGRTAHDFHAGGVKHIDARKTSRSASANDPGSMGPTRRALLVAGLSVLSLSLVLSIAPAFASGGNAGGNASTGTVKIHDVTSGVTFDGSQNEPQVCGFTVIFQFNDPIESGTWSIQEWPAGSTPNIVASGSYDTSVDGTDQTAAISLAAGHYRLEWQADGAHGTKSKTFWVKDGCASAQAETPTPTPTATPTPTPTDAATTSPTATPTPSSETQPSAAADPTSTPSVDPSGTPTPDPTASTAPSATASPTSTPTATPTGGVLDASTTGTPEPSPQGQVADATGSPAGGSLPNTATPEAPTGLLTALGLLLVIASHPFLRRSGHADRS